MSGDNPNNSIVKNTKKNPGDLRRLVGTQPPVKPSANAGVKNSQIIIIIIITTSHTTKPGPG